MLSPITRRVAPAQRLRGRSAHAAVLLAALLGTAGCAPRLQEVEALRAPYDGPRLWGVAPFRNESGASIARVAEIADAFTREIDSTTGLDCVPVNRVIAAMRHARIDGIASRAEAMAVMNRLDLDGLVVGTVTAYDPYRPMKLGLAVELYARTPRDRSGDLDPRSLQRTTRGTDHPAATPAPGPAASASRVFDAANHGTLADLESYAAGRNEPESAYGGEIYLVSMDVYAQFACHRLLHDLLEQEWHRTAAVTGDQ
jgi:hypothetical protein